MLRMSYVTQIKYKKKLKNNNGKKKNDCLQLLLAAK